MTQPVTSSAVRPSPVFFAVLAAFAAATALCLVDTAASRFAVFAFVATGWLMSLIFHEFAHAFVAFRGGDRSVAAKGYLTLDPRKYADPLTSLGFPMFLMLAGGIGLPGGAVWINRSRLSDATASAMSLAGPATNLALAAVLLVPLSTGVIDADSTPTLALAVGFLGFLQITAFVLNMLPVPGLDGFGAIEPHLPASIIKAIRPIANYSLMLLFVALWFVEPLNERFWNLVTSILDVFAVDPNLPRQGYLEFRFWE